MDTKQLLSDLVQLAKKSGLEGGEKAVATFAVGVVAKVKEVAAASPNKIDDAVVAFLAPYESELLALVDKIDGEVG